MMVKKELKILIFTVCLLVTTLIFQVSFSILGEGEDFSYANSIDYTESLNSLRNPERGFYDPIGYNLKVGDNQPLNPKSNLVHLRVGIGAFSSKNNQQEDLELSEDALNALVETIKNVRENNASIIIRFAYDNFNGNANKEPSLNMILTHIEQIGPILLEYSDVVANIELGFFGPWGEMHSSKICTNENVSTALTKLLETTKRKIKVSVRTPGYYAFFRQIDRSLLDTDLPEVGSSFYQVGIYNDGYLGSETDLGTFSNRDIEVKWLSNQAKHTFYGGELVANFASGTPLNTIEYLSKEAFLTHTTYLNPYWNDKVMEGFKTTPYVGEDSIYKNESAYLYIENHLGYRFVLRNSELSISSQEEPLHIKLNIENVGFANLIRRKHVSIVLKNNDDIYELTTNLDATTWDSKKITEESINISLPEAIKEGTYEVYLRISEYGSITNDRNYHCIEFANNHIYNEDLGANYIGKVSIQKVKPTTTPTEQTTPSPTSTPTITTTPTATTTPTPISTPTPTQTTNPTPKPTPIEIAVTTPEPTPRETPANDSNQSNSNESTSNPTNQDSKGSKKYQIYYYYDNVRDTTQTLTFYRPVGTIIDSYMDRLKKGYVLDKTENYPLTITENVKENIIKVYYVKEGIKTPEPEQTPTTDEDDVDSKKPEIQNPKSDSNQKKPTKKNQVMTIIALIFDSFLFLIIMIVSIRLILKVKNGKTYRN